MASCYMSHDTDVNSSLTLHRVPQTNLPLNRMLQRSISLLLVPGPEVQTHDRNQSHSHKLQRGGDPQSGPIRRCVLLSKHRGRYNTSYRAETDLER